MEKRFRRGFFLFDFAAIMAMLASALFPLLWPFNLPHEFWLRQGIEYLLFGTFYFLNLKFFFPLQFERGQKAVYGITIIASIVAIAVIVRWTGSIIDFDQAFAGVFSKPGRPFRTNAIQDIQGILCSAGIYFFGLSYISAVSKKLQRSKLAFEISEKERVEAELAFLKAQINPHFFFNTLHTIYSLTDTDPALAKNSIYSLSHMMRYVLYDTKNDLTPLRNEVNFIEDYMALMKVRIAGDVQIIFDKQTDLPDFEIAPMLFLPFVENAFKHGINALQPSYIYIGISDTPTELRFEVRNSLFEDLGIQIDENEGIGIANTKRRLDLLYSGKYKLDVDRDSTAKEYMITLILKK